MKIYMAGTYSPSFEKKEWESLIQNRLLTYFEKPILDTFDSRINLFLDSGAYSAFTQKKEIKITEYIEYIKNNEDVIDIYANLDVIGSAKDSWKNQRIMEKAGLQPLPVFHVEDKFKYLEKCIAEYPYFCIGGMATGYSSFERTSFLDRCFAAMNVDGVPLNKIHGFGMTSFSLMWRYPWYSVDSTSWALTSAMGAIFVPRHRAGVWVYTEKEWKIDVSIRNSSKKSSYAYLPVKSKELILRYISEKGFSLGKSELKNVPSNYILKDNERWSDKKSRAVEVIVEHGICNCHKQRYALNILYYQELADIISKTPYNIKFLQKKQSKFF